MNLKEAQSHTGHKIFTAGCVKGTCGCCGEIVVALKHLIKHGNQIHCLTLR